MLYKITIHNILTDFLLKINTLDLINAYKISVSEIDSFTLHFLLSLNAYMCNKNN